PGRHLPWLERAGNACRFPRSSSRGHTRNVVSGAAPLRFTAACRPPYAFHARLPGLGNGSNVRCLAAGTVGVVSRELVAWARAYKLPVFSLSLRSRRRGCADEILWS